MKKILSILFLFVLINYANAQEDWFYNSETLEINLKVSSEAITRPTAPDYNIKYVLVNISFVPEDDVNQKILQFETSPAGKIENNALNLRFDNPPAGKLYFNYNANVKTFNRIIPVRKKIKFPIEEIPTEYVKYLQSAEIINSDDRDIVELASKLVEGEDDLFVVVHKLAAWTKNNIKYDLSTLTADVSQKASWVLENKQGVCDELTSLFIAMLRAVGIPAKFVSGIAYTNDPQFPDNWGAHGWAEVYFPGVGFVPFDVTYGEFGYVDPTHIKLEESIDSAEAGTQYRWLARNVDLETEKLDIKANLLSAIGKIDRQVSIKADALKDNVAFGSYNIVEAKLENLNDYYVSTEAILSKSKEIKVFGGNIKQVLLKPKEKKSVYWLIKVNDNLQKNYVYTFPVVVSTLRNSSSETSFTASEKDIAYSYEEMQEILSQKEEEIEKVYSINVKLNCSIDKNEFYDYESALMTCDVKNTGNVFLEGLDVCYKECEEINLGIAREMQIDFIVEEEAGKKDIVVKTTNKDVSKTTNVEFIVLDKPLIKIVNIKNPNEVNFKDAFEVEFELEKASLSNPLNVNIDFIQNGFKKTWNIKEFLESRKFIVKLDGKSLKEGKNDFDILVSYKDGNNIGYDSTAGFNIKLINVTLWQKAQIAFLQFNKSLEHMSLQAAVLLIVSIGIIFIGIVAYVFRKRA